MPARANRAHHRRLCDRGAEPARRASSYTAFVHLPVPRDGTAFPCAATAAGRDDAVPECALEQTRRDNGSPLFRGRLPRAPKSRPSRISSLPRSPRESPRHEADGPDRLFPRRFHQRAEHARQVDEPDRRLRHRQDGAVAVPAAAAAVPLRSSPRPRARVCAGVRADRQRRGERCRRRGAAGSSRVMIPPRSSRRAPRSTRSRIDSSGAGIDERVERSFGCEQHLCLERGHLTSSSAWEPRQGRL